MKRVTDETGNPADIARMFRVADDDTFMRSWFHDPLFASVAVARRAWNRPGVRRAVWSATYRMQVPDAARVFDALTAAGWQWIWQNYSNNAPFPAMEALAAIDRDRAALEAFIRRDARGAATVADYLDLWRADLDTLAQTATELGAWTGPLWQRPVPCSRMSSARKYGDRGEGA